MARARAGDRTGWLTIGALSRATGVPIETLRTWERRYGAPVPHRKPSGHRVYDPGSVGQLRRIAELLKRGHRPAEVLVRTPDEVEAMMRLDPRPPALTRSEPGPAAPRHHYAATHPGMQAIAALLGAVRDMDRARLLDTLRVEWERLGHVAMLDGVVGPFLNELGRAWADGRLQVRHEHFATACLAGFLRRVREPLDALAVGPGAIVGTLPGDRHEAGALMAASVLAARGWRAIELGADTPVPEFAAAARAANARVAAISVSRSVPRARAATYLAALRKALPGRCLLWVGGGGAPHASRGIEVFATLAALDARITAGIERP